VIFYLQEYINVTGFGAEAGQALATSKRIATFIYWFYGTGRSISQRSRNIIVTMELGGKSPIFSSICSSSR
jgi:aldehyde dehydrogenase (NAD+)/aldehyde dehydrogenase